MVYKITKKLPVFGFAVLSMFGCGRTDKISDDDRISVTDTVIVLEYVHPSRESGRKIWVADKKGREIYCNNVSLGPKPAVAPRKGEEVVIERGINSFGAQYLIVLENLTAQRLKQEYMKQR